MLKQVLVLATTACASAFVAPSAVRPSGRACEVRLAAGGGNDPSFDLSVLSARVAQVRSGTFDCRLVVLDSIVPKQKLSITAPPPLVDLFRRPADGRCVVMLGRRGQRLHSHGCEVQMVSCKPRPVVKGIHPEGTADIVRVATRLCEITHIEETSPARMLGMKGRGSWIDPLDPPEPSAEEELKGALPTPPAPDVLARSEALADSVDEWVRLVRDKKRERTPGQLDGVLEDLGPMPPAAAANARALWVSALINPLPALGVALEVRPAALMAKDIDLRLKAVEMGLADSIKRMA